MPALASGSPVSRSAQRLAFGDVGGGIVVGLWPAELKRQADYLYTDGRGGAMVAAATQRGWEVRPSPHLAFFNSAPAQRLYMDPELDAEVYAERWEGADGRLIGQHSGEEVRHHLWPWLKQRGYASAECTTGPYLGALLDVSFGLPRLPCACESR